MAFNEDILDRTRRNHWFREVLATGPHAQVVVMSIPPGGEIGDEVHDGVDQVLVFVEGQGEAILDGARSPVGPDRLVLVPAGTRHNFVNTGSTDLRRNTRRARSIEPRPRPTRRRVPSTRNAPRARGSRRRDAACLGVRPPGPVRHLDVVCRASPVSSYTSAASLRSTW